MVRTRLISSGLGAGGSFPARSPHRGPGAALSRLSHAQFPLRRHPPLLVDHRRARTASVAASRGGRARPSTAQAIGFTSEWWPTSDRNAGQNSHEIGNESWRFKNRA
jgi:hypothetical protein